MCRPDEAVSVTQLLCKLKFILRRSSFVLVLRANSSNSRHSSRHHVHRHSFFCQNVCQGSARSQSLLFANEKVEIAH